jgi:predicted outer membrane repeat protein
MKTLTISFFIFHFSFFIFHFCKAQIPFEGLAADHEGAAAWNADGTGPDPAGYGHPHPFGWGSSLYYGASRDYDGIDPDPDAALGHFLDDINGFPLFVQALADYGFSPGQVKIKIGRINAKNDVEGEDWFTFNNKHYFNKYDGYYLLELTGEQMISGYISYMFFTYDSSIYNNWLFQCNFTSPLYASDSGSSQVQAVAAAFLQDMDGEELRMTGNMTSTGTFFSGNGRVGGVFFDIVSGHLEKGQPELPFTGPAYAHEGIAGWNADGSGPEPVAEGHTFSYGGTDWWMAYYIASRDYDGIDPDPGAALSHVTGGGTGFPNLEIQMAYRGYSMDQLKVKSGIATLGNDIEGVDWWLDGNMHYYHTYGNMVTVEIAGEPILAYAIDTNFTSSDLDMDGHWMSYSTLSPVEDISTNASPNAQFVALSLLKDIGGRFVKAEMEGGGVNSFGPENGRVGAFHKVDSGYMTLGNGQGTFIDAGEVSGTWTAENSPYMINGNIVVPDGQTLAIEPGVIVAIRGPYYIRVDGCVLAEGTAEENILFTHSNPTVWWNGIDFEDTPATNDTSRFSYCTFQYGYAQSAEPFNSGGAMAVKDFGKLKITNCTFQHNKADQMGATYYPTSGAIALWNSSPLIQNCIFRYNYAGTFGGAIFAYENSKPVISGCLFYENSTEYYAGAIGFDEDSKGLLINCTMAGNTAGYGGALAFYTNSSPELVNNIIWGNTATMSGNQVYIEYPSSMPGFYYCDIEDGIGGFGGVPFNGDYLFNLEEDPMFSSNPDEPVYYLTVESPCINEGTPDTSAWFYPQYLPEECLCGNPRIYYGRIDMGAYEIFYGAIEEDHTSMENLAVKPNPFRNSTQLTFELTNPEHLVLEVYNAVGARVAVLEKGFFASGPHTLPWDARGLIDGIYFCRLQAGEKVFTRKIIKMN